MWWCCRWWRFRWVFIACRVSSGWFDPCASLKSQVNLMPSKRMMFDIRSGFIMIHLHPGSSDSSVQSWPVLKSRQFVWTSELLSMRASFLVLNVLNVLNVVAVRPSVAPRQVDWEQLVNSWMPITAVTGEPDGQRWPKAMGSFSIWGIARDDPDSQIIRMTHLSDVQWFIRVVDIWDISTLCPESIWLSPESEHDSWKTHSKNSAQVLLSGVTTHIHSYPINDNDISHRIHVWYIC